MKIKQYKLYRRLEDEYWWFVGMKNIFISSIENLYKRNSNLLILDIGCGTGNIMSEMAGFGSIVGVDKEFIALELCKERGINRVIQGDAKSMPFKDNIFDLLISLNIIEHITDDVSFLKELNRVCKKNGRLIIATSAFNFLWSQHDVVNEHKRRYTKSYLKEIVSKYFTVEKVTYTNFILSPVIWLGIVINNLLGYDAQNPSSGFYRVPVLINSILIRILKIESFILQKINFPFGVSLLCIAKN